MTVSNSDPTESAVVENQPQSCNSNEESHQHSGKVVSFAQPDMNTAFVFWEATVTGRRLIDEMINLGCYYVDEDGKEHEFNEYVMPYGKLPVNVTRNYNLRIVDTGRYRMLKEVRSNKMLKSKSEVAACNDFASWLIQLQKDHFPNKKLILVYFEPRHSKILQLFQNLERFRLLEDVQKILHGCVNGWDLLRPQIGELKDEHRQVLKALVEAHLPSETPLDSAGSRAKAVGRILAKLHGTTSIRMDEHVQESSYLLDQVKKIKEELLKEAQWRPVFADMFRQGLKPRRRAGFLRHLLVETGVSYSEVAEAFKKEDGVKEMMKEKLMVTKPTTTEGTSTTPTTTSPTSPTIADADVEELVKLLNAHLTMPEKPVRRGSGRRGPRTKSMCDATKTAGGKELNNNSSTAVKELANPAEV